MTCDGYGIKKQNTALLAALNQALKEIKDEGVYTKVFAKWYGEEEAAKAVE